MTTMPQQIGTGPERPASPGYVAATGTAVVAGVFSLVVCGLMLVDFARREGTDPLQSPAFQELKAQLANGPRDEQLKEALREEDLRLRQEYFRRRAFTHIGGHLLLLGVAVLLISVHTAATLRPRLPIPGPAEPPRDRLSRTARTARWAVGLSAYALFVAVAAAQLLSHSPLGQSEADVAVAPQSPSSETDTAPDPKEWAKQWPGFRGPDSSGVSAYSEAPLRWDAATGQGILWKTPVPLPGNSSPVLWGDRVFLTGATDSRREVYGFDAASGKLLWQTPLAGTPQSIAKPPEVAEDTGFASPTPVTDGRRVYAVFANGDVAAVDFAGKVLWERSLGIPTSTYGYAASPTMAAGRLVIQFDEATTRERKSKLLALDAATGKTVWETPRAVPCSWSSPIVIEQAGRRQIIAAADPWVIAYAPADGAELWRAKCLSGDHGVTPVFAGGLLQVGNEYSKWSALRVDGQGDVTKTHVAWSAEDGLPDLVSPLVAGDLLLLMTSYGTMTCYDAAGGEMLWQEEFETDVSSSPGVAGKHVYVFTKDKEQGKGWVLEISREGCKRVAENRLGEPCVTSPAFAPRRIYLRGEKHLFCLGEKAEKKE